LLFGGFSKTGYALQIMIDFESVTPGIYSSLTISGFNFVIPSGRYIQIVDLSSYGLSTVITAADISSNPSDYNKEWGIRLTRTDGGTLALQDFDVEGWEDTTGDPMASAYAAGFGTSSSVTVMYGETDNMLGYEQKGPLGSPDFSDFLVVGSGWGYPSGNQGFIFYDNLLFDIPDVQPVPEPATLLLLSSGLIALARFRKKFQK